ncbi:response regulator transcription factor [Pontiellaceae bacterium B12227]|nr:response regulator transcription factor [Pontiellaceae bacterium B12227]
MGLTFSVSIVDDDSDMRDLIQKKLHKSSRYQCIGSYEDPEEALRKIPEENPDIVLMDINMQEVNGIECVRRLKRKLPETHFVMLTVYDDTNHIFQALSAGAIGYLLKRSISEKLISSLDETIKGGSPMDSSIARRVVQSFHMQKNPSSPELETLSDREQQVLQMLAQGSQRKDIAAELDISVHTVDSYIRRIYEKLQVNSRSEAVAKYSGR